MRVLPNPRHRRSPKNLTINQVFPHWDEREGIFGLLESDFTKMPPWADTVEFQTSSLDIAYGARSGEKFIAPLLYRWIDEDNISYEDDEYPLTQTGKQLLRSAIQDMFYLKWAHLWNTYNAEYNPLHTYTLTESGSDERTTDKDGTNTDTKNLTTTDTYEEDGTSSNTRTPNLTDSQVNKVYGFNSSQPVNQSESTATHTGTEGNSGTDSLDSSNTKLQTGTDTLVTDETVDESGSYEKTRTGNLYRSPAELLSFDRDFWLTNYFDIVMADLDKFLTLGIYAESPVNITVF